MEAVTTRERENFMKNKKIFIPVFTLSAALLLTACSGKEAADTTKTQTTQTEAGTEETPAPVPDHSVVHMQRENRRRERTQNTAKNLAKASAGLAGMDESKSPEAEEQKDAPEELAKDEMIRQILREFMA